MLKKKKNLVDNVQQSEISFTISPWHTEIRKQPFHNSNFKRQLFVLLCICILKVTENICQDYCYVHRFYYVSSDN